MRSSEALAPFVRFLACPLCGGELTTRLECTECRQSYPIRNNIPDLGVSETRRTEQVREFYEAAPFPGYPPHDTLAALHSRAQRSDFISRLEHEISRDARVLEIGCGTGQTSIFLARGERMVIGADLAHGSLALASAAAHRFEMSNVAFVRTDLHHPGFKAGAFDVVYCSGVLHHTENPPHAFHSIAPLVRPGGFIIVGLYHVFARLPHRLRRFIARATGYRFIPDPVLSVRALEPDRYRAWLRDQYQHPEEHRHSLREVQSWFAENDIDYLRAYPSAMLAEDEAPLLTPAADNWGLESWIAQAGWLPRLQHEGGLFVAIGQRSLAGDSKAEGVRSNLVHTWRSRGTREGREGHWQQSAGQECLHPLQH